MTGCHTNTATALLSACHEVPEKTLPIQADLSWSPLPHVSLCTAADSFFNSIFFCILLPFCLVCLSRHRPLLGPETHSLQACLPLCPSSNRVLSSQTDLCMSISMYGRAQRTCGRACLRAQTHTYARIYTHTNWNTHTYTLTYKGILLFFQCQFDTLFESRSFYWKLIVCILLIFCWFVCCYETRKSILRLPPWDRSKVRTQSLFSPPLFSRQKFD